MVPLLSLARINFHDQSALTSLISYVKTIGHTTSLPALLCVDLVFQVKGESQMDIIMCDSETVRQISQVLTIRQSNVQGGDRISHI